MIELRALVVKQPYAWALVHTLKPELRDFRINYRGRLAIVAACEDDPKGYALVKRVLYAHHPQLQLPASELLPRRVIVGVLTVQDCIATASDDENVRRILPPAARPWINPARRYAITFGDRVPIEPGIPVRGMPGMFDLPKPTKDALIAHLLRKGIKP